MVSVLAWPPRTVARSSPAGVPRAASASAPESEGVPLAGEGRGFPRSSRLSGPRDFSRVFAEGRRLARNALLLIGRSNPLGHPRLGLAVAKRHVRRAVDRNRIKRIIRESFRDHQEELGGLDVVVLVRGPGMATLDRRVLRKSLDRHWSELVKKCASS